MEGPHSSVFSSSQHIVSTSSSKKKTDTTLSVESSQEPTGSNIFDKYKMIKQKNELLNISTYAQFWKQTSTSQHILLFSFDTEKGRMHMEFLQAKVPHPKATSVYKKTSFEFDVKEVHPTDQMDMHRKTWEMIFSTLKNTSLTAAKLQVSLNNVQSQLKLEKISSLAKDNKIKSLEELVLKIGYDPSNVKAVEELLKKKNADIAFLRKQLKLPTTEDSQVKEMDESEGHKEDMLKLIMEQNEEIREIEDELDKLVKEKEQSVQMVFIPLEAFPLTGVSTTVATTTTEIPSAIPVKVLNASEKLVNSMEDMTLQGEEIKRLQEEVKNLQKMKSMFQASYNTEMHKSQRLSQEIEKLQKETVMAKTLFEANENIWMDIRGSMVEIWPFIQFFFE
jgi:hypothetical protein